MTGERLASEGTTDLRDTMRTIRNRNWLRADRLLTVYLVHPLLCHGPSKKSSNVPILMYHSICNRPEKMRSAYFKTNTSPEDFQAQMELLHRQGYSCVSLEQALPVLRGDQPKSAKLAVITFDDGYRNIFTDAFPVLRQYGFSATVFLATAFVGERTGAFDGIECLTWSEIRELRRHGLRFGSHTVNHPKLYQMEWSEIESELRDSKEQIERRLGERVTSFAYPYAYPQTDSSFIERLTSLLARSGYDCCVTTRLGCARIRDDAFSLKRLPVNTCDDLALFQAKLDGAYDWLRYPQALVKRCKHWL
jgi:peptidoglycan/xylan/chitin deacetylase (PgdA/CDA1 family)